MKRIDTTDARCHVGMKILVSESILLQEYQLADQFRIHLSGMYFSSLGPEWDSAGQRQGDYLHHFDVSLSGRRQVVHDGQVHHIEPGQVWFFPGNTPVERRCQESFEVVFFKFSCECLPGVDPLLDWPGRGTRLVGTCDVDEWRGWLEPGRVFGVMELLKLRSCLLSWLVTAVPELDEVIAQHLRMNVQFAAVFELIEKELGADLRMPKLAKAYGTTDKLFCKEFVRNTGISPKDYVMRRLNQEALQWVINSKCSIVEIAEKLRFTDQFYFSRFFKKFNGVPPSSYRQRFRRI